MSTQIRERQEKQLHYDTVRLEEDKKGRQYDGEKGKRKKETKKHRYWKTGHNETERKKKRPEKNENKHKLQSISLSEDLGRADSAE